MLTSPIMTLLYRIEEFIYVSLGNLGVPTNLRFEVLPLVEALIASVLTALAVSVPVVVFLLLLKLIWRLCRVDFND